MPGAGKSVENTVLDFGLNAVGNTFGLVGDNLKAPELLKSSIDGVLKGGITSGLTTNPSENLKPLIYKFDPLVDLRLDPKK